MRDFGLWKRILLLGRIVFRIREVGLERMKEQECLYDSYSIVLDRYGIKPEINLLQVLQVTEISKVANVGNPIP